MKGVMTMLTALGKTLRKMRLDNGEILKTMADRLGISSAYLSAIEMGKRNIPADFISKLTEIYGLDDESTMKLEESRQESIKEVSFGIDGASANKRAAALVFARKFDDLDELTASKILRIINQSTKEES
jgi:transcriptional regulator with XRE-family HTH domain